MITKPFLSAKTFRAQSTNFLRQDKSLRDHRADPAGQASQPVAPAALLAVISPRHLRIDLSATPSTWMAPVIYAIDIVYQRRWRR
jgi:hypothetical protein